MKNSYHPRVLQIMIVLCGCALNLALGGTATAATYNDVTDFSLTGNPSGTWTYGTVTDLQGDGFTKFTTPEALTNFNGTGEVWDNGGAVPNRDSIIKNTNGNTISGYTIVLPTDELNLDSESLIVDLRWTAPATGIYDVSGLFDRTDTSAAPVSIRIVENNTLTLLTQDNFSTYKNTDSFDFTALPLPAGTVLDFIQGASQYNNDSTGLAATISTVPEPSSMALLALGVAGVIGWKQRRRPIC